MENLRSLGARTIHNPRMAFPPIRPIPLRRHEAWRHRHGLRGGARLFARVPAAALAAAPLRAAPALVAASATSPDAVIFVTVGFYACFWCHEMDRAVFSDPGVAAPMP
ncbi:MAG: hypothetical protein B7X31_04060 [Thiomonas sp. 13-66-29]|jgi:hypothetical protein|nr:MAG: hypothetical protein B7X31_04060 [Thiomonas sp. 13-66-29]